MKNKKTNKRQFTLIELIIVIVVIGILAGMALPKFLGVQRNAKVAAMEQDLDVIEKAVMQYVTATDDGSYPFLDTNGDKTINEEDLYFKTGTIPQTLTDSLLKASGDDGSKIYKLDMDKLKPYISKIKYPDTEYLYSEKSDTAIDPIGKADGDNFIHHIIGSGNIGSTTPNEQLFQFTNIVMGTQHVLGIGNDGNLYSWGDSGSGSLGIDAGVISNDYPTPQRITLPECVKGGKIYSTYFCSMTIATDGNLYAWGRNESGQIGVGSSIHQTTPQLVKLANGVKPKELKLADKHVLAIGDDGNLYAWGNNKYGQIGVGNTIDQTTPQLINLAEGVKPKKIFTSYYESFAIGDDGNLYSWGNNDNGLLGLGNQINQLTPKKVVFPDNIKVTDLYIGSITNDYVAKGDNGVFYGWGYNSYGALGLGDTNIKTSPKKLIIPDGEKPVTFVMGYNNAFFITETGNVYSSGKNWSGELGVGDTTTHSTFTKLNFPNNQKQKEVHVSEDGTSFSIGEDGNLYGWGYNAEGELGLGDTTERFSPELLTLPNGAKPMYISSGQYSALIKGSDNNFYSSGANWSGQRGTGTMDESTVFTKVISPTKNN